MYKLPDILPDGEKYIPGICIFCKKPFDEETSGGFYYGHRQCAEDFETDCHKRDIQDLIARCPPGTRFDLAGGAACN